MVYAGVCRGSSVAGCLGELRGNGYPNTFSVTVGWTILMPFSRASHPHVCPCWRDGRHEATLFYLKVFR